MGVKITNNATTTTVGAVSSTALSLTVASGTGALFPVLGGGDYFYATLVSAGGTYEVIKVTARVGDTMTIVRAQEGTTAQNFASGSRIEVRVTAASIQDMLDRHDPASEISFTPTGGISSNNVQGAIAELDSEAAKSAALTASSGSSLVGYISAGTGTQLRTVQAKLRDVVSAKDFGAVGDGVTNDTVALKATFDYAIPLALPVELEGIYRITGPIQPYVAARASGGLHILVKGKVSITVDPASVGFSDVLYFHTTAFNSCSILGGELNINGNDKAGRGITIRHDDGSGGDVLIEAKLKLTNFLETSASATRENAALEIYGLYGSVRIDSPYVYSVNRTNPTTGGSAGVTVGNCSGNVEINNPWMEQILCGPGAATDGDGIKAFGRNPSVATEEYVGTITINGGNFVNCQGRSCKVRGTLVNILYPRVRRTTVVAIPQGVDFDFQACVNATLVDPSYEYFGTAGVAPFGAGSSFSCVVFQSTVTNIDGVARNIGGKIVSNVAFPRYAAFNTASGARGVYAEVSGVKAIPSGSLTTTMLTRAIVEFDAAAVNSKATATKYVVNDNQFPMVNVPALGYTGLGSPVSITQLSWEVCNNRNTINSTYGRVLRNISGSDIRSVANFAVYGNQRFRTFGPFTSFAFTEIAPGSAFFVDLTASLSITNPPPWGTVGQALVEVLDCWDSGSLTAVRVTVNRGEKGSEIFYSYDSGSNWFANTLPLRTAAAILAIGNTINTQNKVAGLQVFDTTNSRIMVATSSAAGGSWAVADGSAFVFPV